jgi:hypothetical protein
LQTPLLFKSIVDPKLLAHMRILTVLLLFCLMAEDLPGDGTVTRSGFLGISLKTTTFEQADSLLTHKSFKEPNRYFKSILFSNGTSSTLNLPSYFVSIGKSEIKITLKGYSTVGRILISNIKSGGDVRYKDIVLGQTKVSDIPSIKGKNWTESEDVDGNVSLTINYKGIEVGVDPNSTVQLLDRPITLFVLSKTGGANSD